jgi:aerobic carbon-monoxide dehydrogenase small subunit
MRVQLSVNGTPHDLEIEPRTLLVQLLRQHLGLTGTHVGCDTTQCGACVVHLDGRPVKSCTMLALSAEGAAITTIEGIGAPDRPHRMQQAFRDHHALQCGFCTSGMIMTACAIVERFGPNLDDHSAREALEGNICRCTGYETIVAAILEVAREAEHV